MADRLRLMQSLLRAQQFSRSPFYFSFPAGCDLVIWTTERRSHCQRMCGCIYGGIQRVTAASGVVERGRNQQDFLRSVRQNSGTLYRRSLSYSYDATSGVQANARPRYGPKQFDSQRHEISPFEPSICGPSSTWIESLSRCRDVDLHDSRFSYR